MSTKKDRSKANLLISEIQEITTTDRVAERQSLTLITAKFAELIVIYNRQSNQTQRWMMVMTLVLIVLTFVIMFKM